MDNQITAYPILNGKVFRPEDSALDIIIFDYHRIAIFVGTWCFVYFLCTGSGASTTISSSVNQLPFYHSHHCLIVLGKKIRNFQCWPQKMNSIDVGPTLAKSSMISTPFYQNNGSKWTEMDAGGTFAVTDKNVQAPVVWNKSDRTNNDRRTETKIIYVIANVNMWDDQWKWKCAWK